MKRMFSGKILAIQVLQFPKVLQQLNSLIEPNIQSTEANTITINGHLTIIEK